MELKYLVNEQSKKKQSDSLCTIIKIIFDSDCHKIKFSMNVQWHGPIVSISKSIQWIDQMLFTMFHWNEHTKCDLDIAFTHKHREV